MKRRSGMSDPAPPTDPGPLGGNDLLQAMATSLRQRVAQRRRAEARLAGFVFDERSGPAAGPVAELGAVDWRYHAARSLQAATEPEALALLTRLRGGPLGLSKLARLMGTPDLAAAAERVGGLAGAGLVARELETERVSLAPLGTAILELLDELARRAAAGGSLA